MANVLQVYKQIQTLQQSYHELAVGQDALLKLIAESEVPEQVYNSNAIENSTLSLEETDKILHQLDLDRYINERELFEARNLARVVEYTASKASEAELNMEVMLFLHRMLISNIRDDIAGRLRSKDEWVRVGSHIAAAPEHVPNNLQAMFTTWRSSGHEHIVKRIARFHLTFEHIHPFVDGNGRIGRVLNNYLLIRDHHVPINIKFIDRSRYYDAFSEFDEKGKTGIMEEMVGRALCSAYHKRLAYLKSQTIVSLADYARQSGESHPNLINKAKRQTIPAFWERGRWKIGIST